MSYMSEATKSEAVRLQQLTAHAYAQSRVLAAWALEGVDEDEHFYAINYQRRAARAALLVLNILCD